MDIYEYELLEKLADNNDLYGMRRILDSYLDNRIEKPKVKINKKKILKYLNHLIQCNESNAMLALGALYYTGDDGIVPQDFAKAEYWYAKAAEPTTSFFDSHYNSQAMTNLGYIYYYGRTNTPDFEKAFYCYAKAACMGHPNAMYKIGDMYKNGLFVAKNEDKAFHWYQEAWHCLTDVYYGDDDIEDSDDDYQFASTALRLGESYLYGVGTDISLSEAEKYLKIAKKRFNKLKKIKYTHWIIEGPLNTVTELLGKLRVLIKKE